MRSRAVAVAALAGCASVLAVASVAWACTSFSTITLSTAVGTPGSEVTVAGERAAANAPVEVRWNSRSGALLATATTDADGNFTVPVRIPESLPGLHVVLAADGSGDTARAAFEIPGASAAGERPAVAAPVSSGSSPMSGVALGAGVLAAGVVLIGGGAFVLVAGRRRATVLG